MKLTYTIDIYRPDQCTCERINKRIACPKCYYPPSEARYDLGPDEDENCGCKICDGLNILNDKVIGKEK